MLLLKLGTAGLLKTKTEWENSISVQNWGYVWGRHNQDNIWINKAHFHKNNRKKIKSFSHKKKSTYDVLLLQENQWLVVPYFIIA